MTTESMPEFTAEFLPFAQLLALELVTFTPDPVEAALSLREEPCIRPAVMHGGAVMALANTSKSPVTITY